MESIDWLFFQDKRRINANLSILFSLLFSAHRDHHHSFHRC
ncbi:MAG: hypothetical protein ACH350_01365 [Parachlamydiaceae bacterium]